MGYYDEMDKKSTHDTHTISHNKFNFNNLNSIYSMKIISIHNDVLKRLVHFRKRT